MHEAQTPTLIHGHTHRPAHEDLAPGFLREVLSDWDLDHPGTPRAEVLRLKRSGLSRIPLSR
jgi:UDP-2,3-diacylglucosamine hydrolase